MKKNNLLLLLFTFFFLLNVQAQDFQPEFTGFESLGNSDMVNLITGNFTYNIPLLNVPGPDGGFTIPLSYHAGIRVEDEASWVGLGWSLNAGAINRKVNYFPDDFNGYRIENHLEHPGDDIYSVISLLGHYTYHSEEGISGAIGYGDILQIPFGDERNYEILGFEYDKFDNKFEKWVPEKTGFAALDVTAFFVPGGTTWTELSAVQKGISIGISGANIARSAYGIAQAANMLAHTDFSKNAGLWNIHTTYNYQGILHGTFMTHTSIYLNANINENAYGAVYMHEAQSEIIDGETRFARTGKVPTHDYSMYVDPVKYQWSKNPLSIAYDNFMVAADGISGTIQPYRHETGSMATTNFGADGSGSRGEIKRFNDFPFENYKVNFKYANEAGNSYLHHLGENVSIPSTDLEIEDQFGIEIDPNDLSTFWDPVITDHTLDYASKRTKSNTAGLQNNHLEAGNYIMWYSNGEIAGVTGYSSAIDNGFIDFAPASERYNIRDEYAKVFPSTRSTTRSWSGIGGFSITRSDGLTYHFSLPIYSKIRYDENYKDIDSESEDMYITTLNDNKYAITWLLTAITGSDFVDRGEVGILDDADWGYWVKINYEKTEGDFYNRTPRSGYTYSNDRKSWGFSYSVTEQYYLKSIETPSHISLFHKTQRSDRRDNNIVSGVDAKYSLKLSEVFLLNKSDYYNCISLFGNDNITNFLKGSEPVSGLLNNIHNKQLMRIQFNYDYSLCQGYPSNLSSGGKLTLLGVETYYRNNQKVHPGFSFGYSSNNPTYGLSKWDGWGMYKSDGTEITGGHTATGDGTEWNLTRITSPIGNSLLIDYERDDYQKVSGFDIGATKLGGDNRVLSISIYDGNTLINSARYIYTTDGTIYGGTSGECSFEPSYCQSDIDLYDADKYVKEKTSIDFPGTPVIYSKVNVSSGGWGGVPLTEEIFEFKTPDISMIELDSKPLIEESDGIRVVVVQNYIQKIKTAGIGAINKITQYVNGIKQGETIFNYSSEFEGDMGKYTQGTILKEDCNHTFCQEADKYYWRLFRTTKVYFPYILTSIEKKSEENELIVSNYYDYTTGLLKERVTETNTGRKIKEVKLLAHEVYDEMDSKIYNNSNKNMLSQEAGNLMYLYLNSNWKVLSGLVQTWRSDWNDTYLEWNTSGSPNEFLVYNGDDNIINCRKHKSFEWGGDLNVADGTFGSSFDIYNSPEKLVSRWSDFNGNGENGWIKTSEVIRYDHYSYPLEITDLNGDFAATKKDAFGFKTIASAANSSLTSFAATSFEERVPLKNGSTTVSYHFGANVLGPLEGSILASSSEIQPHTGNYCLAITSGNTGCRYLANGPNLLKNQKYRVSAWVHNSTAGAAQIKIKFDDVLQSVTQNTVGTFGDWTLLNLDFTLPVSSSSFEVYVNAYGGDCYIDDFRVSPYDAAVTSYTYDNAGNITAVLNNDNFATKYEYDAAGKLVGVFIETKNGFEKTAEYKYKYAD